MRSRPPIIERVYQPDEESCMHALEFLLKHSAAEGDGGEEHARKESNASRAGRIVPQKP
jgi:hypothetical protein